MFDASKTYFQPMQQGSGMDAAPQEMPAPPVAPLPPELALAMAYVPLQTDNSVYDDRQALQEGTLFPALNKPFLGGGGR